MKITRERLFLIALIATTILAVVVAPFMVHGREIIVRIAALRRAKSKIVLKQEWCFRLMNDPGYFEKGIYTDNIDAYNNVIEEFQKLYEQTLAADRTANARILKGINQVKSLGFRLSA